MEILIIKTVSCPEYSVLETFVEYSSQFIPSFCLIYSSFPVYSFVHILVFKLSSSIVLISLFFSLYSFKFTLITPLVGGYDNNGVSSRPEESYSTIGCRYLYNIKQNIPFTLFFLHH